MIQTASLRRRAAALFVDWLMAVLVATAFLPRGPWWPLAVFAVVQVILVGTIGHSVGHRLFGLHVVRADGGGLAGPVSALVRTGLLVLVVPALVVDGDGRGLHDRAAGTAVTRL